MSSTLFSKLVSCFVLSFFFAGISGARASTGSLTASNGTINYTVTFTTTTCGIPRQIYTVTKYEFSSFSYTAAGVTTSLSGGPIYSSVTNGPSSQGCIATINDLDYTLSMPTAKFVVEENEGNIKFISADYFVTGYIDPKYVIVGVTYAPPGPSSNVQYTQAASLSTTSGISNTFTSSTTTSVSLGTALDIFGFITGSVTQNYSQTSSQSNTSSNSVTTTESASRVNETYGFPNLPQVYPPHDYDEVWLWLNPVVVLSIDPENTTSVTWNGYGYDENDQPTLDIYPVAIGYLNGDFGAMDASTTTELSRSWAASAITYPNGPGLTTADYAEILTADPFANSSYVFNPVETSSPVTTSDNRFTLSGGISGTAQNFPVVQASPGTTASSSTYSNTYTTVGTAGQSATYSNSTTYGVDVSFKGSDFLTGLTGDIKTANTYTTSYTLNNSISNTSTQIDQLTVAGPPCGSTTTPCIPSYSGPPEYDVYQDNIFGSFAFIPE